MRGRTRNNGNNKGPNPLTRSYESNGPDVKIRGTAQHIAEKYAQLSRDAQASGDPVAAESYLQHAEHYFRIIAGAQEALRQQYGQFQRDDEQEEGEMEEGGNGFNYEGSEQPSIEDLEFAPQPSYDNNQGQGQVEGRRETRHLRRGRYGRLDRQHRPNNNDQPRFESDSDGGEDQPRYPRQDRPERQDRQERPVRQESAERQERPVRQESAERLERPERPVRQERPERLEPVVERPVRRRAAPRVAAVADDEGSSSLPAFLTTPVRQPAAKAEVTETLFGGADAPEEAKPVRRRRTVRTVDKTEAGADEI